jgi:hypothetical protein
MNLYQELDKRTAPPPCAGPVRQLPPDEIVALAASGEITPIGEIPPVRRPHRLCFPPDRYRYRSTYGRRR